MPPDADVSAPRAELHDLVAAILYRGAQASPDCERELLTSPGMQLVQTIVQATSQARCSEEPCLASSGRATAFTAGNVTTQSWIKRHETEAWCAGFGRAVAAAAGHRGGRGGGPPAPAAGGPARRRPGSSAAPLSPQCKAAACWVHQFLIGNALEMTMSVANV